MKKILLSLIVLTAFSFGFKLNAQDFFENFTSTSSGSFRADWFVGANTDVAGYGRPGLCAIADKGLQTPGVGRTAPTGFILPVINYDPATTNLIIKFKIYVFDGNLKCLSAKDFPCPTSVNAYIIPSSGPFAPTGIPANAYTSLPNYQIVYANAENSIIFNNFSLPAGVTNFRVQLSFKSVASNCSSSGTKFIFDDLAINGATCPGICPPVANTDYFNSDAQNLFAASYTSFKANVYGGYAPWASVVPTGFEKGSLAYSPATNSGADYDLNGTPLSGVTFSKLTDPIIVTSNPGCEIPLAGSVVFNSNGTFTYTKGAACVTRVSFSYKVSLNSNPDLFGMATVIIDLAGQNINLPVKFKSVSATRNKERVAVKWETASEVNNRGFNVQRNTNGEWKNIAFVFSQSNEGTSSSTLFYQYNDLNTAKGVSQYRIQQVDFDGKAAYSEVRSVRGESMKKSIIAFPNPSMDGKVTLILEDNSAKNVIVSDMSGRIVKQYKNITANNLSIDMLQSGMYSIQVTDLSTAEITVEKVVIKKR
jgi:hypothetical protein